MNKINLNLEYCHGISKLKYEFNFNKKKLAVIYAPNGTMKTSLTKTLLDLKEDRETRDEVFPERKSKRSIIKSSGESVNGNEILVVESINHDFVPGKVTNLLASKKLKREYDDINNKIDMQKNKLLKVLQDVSGITIKKGLESQITSVFNKHENEILECLWELSESDFFEKCENFSYLRYTNIINEKVELFLKNKNVKSLIDEYITRYNELIENSTVFKKGVFNHNNANDIGKSLHDNGFFKAEYKLIMGHEGMIVNTQEELDKIILEEKQKILEDSTLMKDFDAIDKLIKNKELKELRKILEGNTAIILELKNYNEFTKKMWISYLKYNKEVNDEYLLLVNLYKSSKDKIQEILKKAKKEKTKWDTVVKIFNNRFDVPFIVEIENQEDVILKENKATLNFKYKDCSNEKGVSKNELLNILSQGEKRALYILNVIFEIEGIKEEQKKTLVIFDDIADSFDYKNKYAIVEYLKDIKENDLFNMIILTHNFDFYRTVGDRLEAKCLMTSKSEGEIKILNGKYVKDIFNIWKNTFNNNDKIMVASVPFIRNIVSYIKGNDSPEYIFLTKLLHIKPDTKTRKIKELEEVFNEIWYTNKIIEGRERLVIDVIYEQADEIYNNNDDDVLDLENKIVLSIAIRLIAEEYMINKINDSDFVSEIKGIQTGVLLKRFKEIFYNEVNLIKTLEQVNLMTSENIHVNSFMYEPLLDLSERHLKQLYNKIKSLNISEEVKEAAITTLL